MEFWLIFGCGLLLYLVIKSINKASAKQCRRTQMTTPKKDERVRAASSNRVSVRHEEHDDEGDFATFTLYGYEETKSKNQAVGKWITPEETVSVKGHTITRGNFYYGGQLSSLDGSETEASLVDDSFKVSKQALTYEDESLGYWPKYISISEECRGAFLCWLASERNDPTTSLGYVFIYFYGLERRIVVDSIQGNVDDTEFSSIFDEIIRLKEIYCSSRSFLNYSIRLLEIMCLLRPNIVTHTELENNPIQNSILLKYKLAQVVEGGKAIPPNLALAWLKFIPDYSLRKPARRCAYEFSQMFNRIYLKKYNGGLIVRPNSTRLRIQYMPASSTLRGINIPHDDLPDPSSLKGPTKKLTALADECIEALDAYSRYLGKSDTSRTDIAAALLLPEELNDLGATLCLSEFKQWAEDCVTHQGGIVDFIKLWQFTKMPIPTKINKKESELIQSLAEKAGFGIVPDARYHHAKPSPDGKLVLFIEGHGKYFEPSKAFNEMGMTLRLGAIVATIDSHVDETEFAFLKQLINHDTNLSPVEKRSLHSYLVWRLNTPLNITGLKNQLKRLGSKEKDTVSKILIGVALADGKIDPDEIKQLENLYGLLGLDKSLVTSDIHNLTTAKSIRHLSETPEVALGTSRSLQLDESILAIHESQTKDVQSMLSAIFMDEENNDASASEEYYIEQEDIGIDAQHYALYESLINRDRWSRVELNALCKKFGLMTNGAIETINDWAFEKVETPVLEEETDSVYINQEIVEELEG